MAVGAVRLKDEQGRTIFDSESFSNRVVYYERLQMSFGTDVTRTIPDLGDMSMIWVESEGALPPYSVNGNTVYVRGIGQTPIQVTIMAMSFG